MGKSLDVMGSEENLDEEFHYVCFVRLGEIRLYIRDVTENGLSWCYDPQNALVSTTPEDLIDLQERFQRELFRGQLQAQELRFAADGYRRALAGIRAFGSGD